MFYTRVMSLPQILRNRIERGFGGAGGDGGEGGEAGLGGLGQAALSLNADERIGLLVCTRPGGRGGDGGSGGDGGGGGGGCGGQAAGIYVGGSFDAVPALFARDNRFPLTGAAGTGGRGGLSLANLGLDGADGRYVEVAE
jgi:hypothetical protein